MRHDVGQGGRHYKTAQVNHTGPFPNNDEHTVGQPFSQACFCKDHAYGEGGENEENRGVHEILEGLFGRAYQEHGLKYTDNETGNADGNNFKDPPESGQEKNGKCSLAFPTEHEMLPLGVNRIGPW